MNKLKTIALILSFVMIGIPLVTMATNMPSFGNGTNNPISTPVAASSIASSYSNTAYLNTTTSYYKANSVGQESTQTVTFNAQAGSSNSVEIDNSTPTGTTTCAEWTQTFSASVYGSNGIQFEGLEFSTGDTTTGDYSIGTVYINLTEPSGTSQKLTL